MVTVSTQIILDDGRSHCELIVHNGKVTHTIWAHSPREPVKDMGIYARELNQAVKLIKDHMREKQCH